jgi:bis(5'-nucleosyl)-tetraphosphatase (symmetrical)
VTGVTWAIGDVHGCTRTLHRLLDRLPWDRGADRVWLVGDLVGHGPDPAGTVRLAAALADEIGERFVAVLGNHDARLIAVRDGAVESRKAAKVLDQMREARDCDELLDWLANRPLLHADDGRVLVHAGLHPGWTVEQALVRTREAEAQLRGRQRSVVLSAAFDPASSESPGSQPDAIAAETVRVVTTVRTLDRNGQLDPHTGSPEEAPPGRRPWFELDALALRDAIVVFGHWAALGLRMGERWIALDSGCAWGGPLSAVRLEDRETVQTARLD